MDSSKSQQFLENWIDLLNEKGMNNTALSSEKYIEHNIELLKSAQSKNTHRSYEEFNILKRYDLLSVGGVEEFLKKRTNHSEQTLYYVTNEELYDKISYSSRSWRHQ